jgi:hypothetical protein
MKLTNHKKGNYPHIEGTIMHGTIKMTKIEWHNVDVFLRKEYKKAEKTCNTYTRDGLKRLFGNLYGIEPKENTPFCIGITATTLMAYHFAVIGYKSNRNYRIIIK